ncbi:SoxR reducing system RseC family protein [Vallitalea sp.]|jgi:sigma-E factor negative regulatory protein RseC|uniref:SoxR reducing system RseC family protein n=1 Tax=Vallitalea sp. TaxID=1882829 RepID=UPI0025EABD14|nr:SoxR reducing system RseC family protein [Vallitalea sp.]MCT4687608.1 SoxR reducing system RseC family protein [Vallitalea sp.]
MAETGIVIKETGKYVTVKLERREACAKCRACTAGFETKDMIIEAENICDAKEGDEVEISLEQSNFLKAVLIMYTVPLIFLFVGLGVGYLISYALHLQSVEIIAVIFGFVLLAISYLIIRSNEDKWRDKKFRPVANNIVRTKEI